MDDRSKILDITTIYTIIEKCNKEIKDFEDIINRKQGWNCTNSKELEELKNAISCLKKYKDTIATINAIKRGLL